LPLAYYSRRLSWYVWLPVDAICTSSGESRDLPLVGSSFKKAKIGMR
jgi:hypothetical protein